MSILHSAERKQAINHDMPKFYSLSERTLRRLEKIAEVACFGVIPAAKAPHKQPSAELVASFLDATPPQTTTTTELLDELDAPYDEEAINASVAQIKITRSPEQ